MADEVRITTLCPTCDGTGELPFVGVRLQPDDGWLHLGTEPRNGLYLIANDLGQVCPIQSRDGFRIVQSMAGFADWEYGSTPLAWRPLPSPPNSTWLRPLIMSGAEPSPPTLVDAHAKAQD